MEARGNSDSGRAMERDAEPGAALRHAEADGRAPREELSAGSQAPVGVVAAETPEADSPITTDRYCVACAYNLRGLRPSQACPECQTPIAQSLRGILLRFASVDYVRTVHRGALILVIGIPAYWAMVIGAIFVDVLAPVAAQAANQPTLTSVADGVMDFGAVGFSLLLAFGYWKYSTPDPAMSIREGPSTARKVLRTMVVLQLVAEIGSGFVAQAIRPAALPGPVTLDLVFMGMSFVCGIVQFFAVLSYTRWLVRRVPEPAMMKRCTRYQWLLPTLAVLGSIILMIGFVVAIVMYWSLLNDVRGQLRRILRARRSDSIERVSPTPSTHP
ncbi:MAG: hypothetical protein SFZ23_03500 [Planctomycetota bacterium]|nr:hypothetical protein [Planctomycetota bacterium]